MEYELNLFFVKSPCRFPALHAMISPPFGELDFWFVHYSLFQSRGRNLRRRVNFCMVHFRQFSVENIMCLTNLVFSRSEMKYQLARGFHPFSGNRASLQEDPFCLEHIETHNCSIVPRSSGLSKRNLISILLMRVDSISGQRSRAVSSPATLLGVLPKLSKRKVCEKSCGHHVIQRVD